MQKRKGIGMRWSVLLDGAVWAGLALLSALALFKYIHPPWLLIVLWFSLHPITMIAYALAKWSMYYPRYVWSIRSWVITTGWLWLFQSLFFVHHIVTDGFFAPLGAIDAGSATLAAGVALYIWFDAFWAELIQPFPLVRLSEAVKALGKKKKTEEV